MTIDFVTLVSGLTIVAIMIVNSLLMSKHVKTYRKKISA